MNPFRESREIVRDSMRDQIRSTEMIYGPLKKRTIKKLEQCVNMPIMTRVYLEELRRCEDELRGAQKMREEFGL